MRRNTAINRRELDGKCRRRKENSVGEKKDGVVAWREKSQLAMIEEEMGEESGMATTPRKSVMTWKS